MQKRSQFIITTLLIITNFLYSDIANARVRVIYFVPNDRTPQNQIHNTIGTQMKAVQSFYAQQMDTYGFGERAFALEVDHTGKVITHTIIGNHGNAHYLQGTLEKVEAEIQNRFNAGNEIYVAFVDLSNERVDGNCGIARYEGGPVLIPARGDCIEGEGGIDLIAHELGHAFNLLHDFRDDTHIMSYGYGRNKLSKCAATFLSVSPYYNGRTPKVDKPATIQMVSGTQPPTTGDWRIRFAVSDPDGLFQVQFEHAFENKPAGIIECQPIQGTSSTRVTLTMPVGAKLSRVNHIWVRVVDNNGNTQTQDYTLNIEEQAETTESITYLTLSYEADNSIVPKNNKAHWDSWIGYIWEKTPDGQTNQKSPYYVSHQYTDVWDNWFYQHAPSRIEYDISTLGNSQFDGWFYLAHPCSDNDPPASIEFIAYADGSKIYNSGMKSGDKPEDRNTHISFSIPENTETLTIEISIGESDVCDHFVIGNARLMHEGTEHTPETIITATPPETNTMGNTNVNSDGVVNLNATETMLTLSYDSPDALMPTNPKVEWQTWGQLWEKTPDGLVPRTPNGLFPASVFRGEDWKHFFYAHAPSRIVYDISGGNYESFDAFFDMPNPCGNFAKIEVVFLADGTEIYNSGVLQGSAGRHSRITFDIPEGAKTLTLRVSDLGDPGCDHFVFGNARLLHGESFITEAVTPPEPITDNDIGDRSDRVSLLPISVQSPNIGQLLKLSVKITNGKNVAGYQATVQFNDTALRYVESSNNDYLPDGAFFVPPILEGNLVKLNAASLAGESNGDGTLATVTFEVIAVKASILTLSDVLLSNSIGETFAPQVENSQITEPTKLIGDVNGDGTVNIGDLVLVASNLGQTGQNAADVNSDGVINIADLVLVAGALGTHASAAPSIHLQALEMITATEVKQWLSAAQQLNLTDMKSQRGVLFLQQLLIALTPKETALLPNFPNPFNPETWIPYHLAKDANVTLHIYAINGELVRTLTFEHQAAGKYQNRSRAAYWDGKNAFGEPVASGLYFYTLTTGDFTATRKMLIRK